MIAVKHAQENLSVTEVLDRLKRKRSARNVAGMRRFGIVGEKRLGVGMPALRSLARIAGKSHTLAAGLWKTGIPEAMIVASLVDDPLLVTPAQMDRWVGDLQSWDVCDQVCQNLFRKSAFSIGKIRDWSRRDAEFIKRAAFTLIACLAVHDKESDDERFIRLLPLIRREASDGRNYVKKSVSWALRSIGKRNSRCRKAALRAVEEIRCLGTSPARWIASDALHDLGRITPPQNSRSRPNGTHHE